ncbi:type VI secretion system amidase effector protein Tae4 [Brenneria tiliae]|uniref:type VI secretion system amidase effector protein Tae4 n=1 Tax=Brenneria tiliae TaxID=2914984 RepID=UPI002014F04A|nr:type VI secretion system amidase effector protein Tae4 [Brenneria tiliae]MCL2897379.1 type VI secretion system amidase effector protein Tae4 [Brenneria tiliae]MCL2901678.1 type VI secretion system amidase effector protein Tae4 [Brenneria tiliae]
MSTALIHMTKINQEHRTMGIRPGFIAAWTAAKQIYDPNDPIGKVKDTIGGTVKRNFEIPVRDGGWENSCAVRMSYVLNYTGHPIPRIGSKTVSGADRKWYFYRVKDVIEYLNNVWGNADLIINYPQLPVEQLKNKNGLILFEVSGWGDANGHATFWNGSLCSDHCYFNDTNANYTTNKANFWELS